ncbi:hypothetical protein ACFO1B_30860 [Dactylosporangium siamense]|uniref:DeoxyPurine in DNA protein A domain-containing protein n=1 Tax=Dactylosporangium siamense TaxID=685454 RepID=A0A919PQZ8_9ACTN|nr:hypothetical protein [Dactylosporangium siamense]GIG48122.1 hypothetical protein Dsi01nite_061630 [Dactylosporangium siamense]
MNRPVFYLGTHQPGWLRKARVRLFVADPRLRVYKALPEAVEEWAADSGGFTELQKYGRWTVTPRDYIARVRRYRNDIGRLAWLAPQDWMCEPLIINGGTVNGKRFAGTRLSVAEHQRRTVLNYVQLRDLAPDLPIIPVVQGWTPDDYARCVDLYWTLAGIDLSTAGRVGVGSVCRRQGTAEAGHIIRRLRAAGLSQLHLFGFKVLGLIQHADLLTNRDTCDSLAWSDTARKLRRPALAQCVLAGRHKNCANCLPYALHWRRSMLAAAAPLTQPRTYGAAV